jgi:hypothetical protein
MNASMTEDRVVAAFHRLLMDAASGGQAKVDALVALTQRTVFAVTWAADPNSGLRTLTNSAGHSALPLFTTVPLLQSAARRYGWVDQGGAVFHREVGAREALRHAVAHEVAFVIVDIDAPHELEIDRDEIGPLLTPLARRESTGPYAGVGRVSSDMIKAVKPSSRATPARGVERIDQTPRAVAVGSAIPHGPSGTPPSGVQGGVQGGAPVMNERTAAPTSPPGGLPRIDVQPMTPPGGAQVPHATFGTGSSVTVAPLGSPPDDPLLDVLSAVLREYPEVEWASLAAVSRGPTSPVPTICLRVDAAFRARVAEIMSKLRGAGETRGATLDCLILDDQVVMRAARQDGKVFYPWRRR